MKTKSILAIAAMASMMGSAERMYSTEPRAQANVSGDFSNNEISLKRNKKANPRIKKKRKHNRSLWEKD